jgi:UDP-N-acetylglucosamine 2-epimerase (non-hydrolysing)
MAPLIQRFYKEKDFVVKVCNTGQHKDLLDPIIDFFQLSIDYNLQLMMPNQGLHELTAAIILHLKPVLEKEKPDYVFVHGDTTTSFAASLAAFYSGIKIAHVEAGLRTFNKKAPFPEEINRSLTARMANIHFAPTQTAKDNLLSEGIREPIEVTGNTVIDALLDATKLIDENSIEIQHLKQIIDINKRIILFTGHRRENFGDGFEEIFAGGISCSSKSQC